MNTSFLLITPPFTQLNTPYPATAYIKGFLHTKNITAAQADLGLDVTLALFSKNGLDKLFNSIDSQSIECSENAKRILALKDSYIHTIEDAIGFLQGKQPTLAHRIAKRCLLPEASRFAQLNDLEWAFGAMGIQDQAKHIATLYLEDLSDFIQELVDPHFGFSRYAERLGRSAAQFDELYDALQNEYTFIDQLCIEALKQYVEKFQPAIIAFSVPFPGNLYSAFRAAQWIRKHYPQIKIAMGGGFPNTELRSLSDPKVFEFFHFITLDDGEAPLEQLLQYVNGHIGTDALKRTFYLEGDRVVFVDDFRVKDYKQADLGTPDYSGLKLDQYINAIEVANPMHRLWSDGRWNKLTMAHGCYWGKCTFCDVSLDYISRYEPATATLICDRMETLMAATGETGFHFVDEAAPPSLMKALAVEIIRRKLNVSWWANVRFEKSFTRDLCLLLRDSGCMAVSGGLEVASDRLLGLIQKGITVAQVARVNKNFTEAGIMVHAYLMYGFPTQTAQETIDSLEMVRQMFKAGILQSAFWHRFAMTAHSPVGMNPDKFNVIIPGDQQGSFANNDRIHEDPTGADHDLYGEGLKKSLFNYMHGLCMDDPLHKWFESKVPKTTIPSDHILQLLQDAYQDTPASNAKIYWTGHCTSLTFLTQTKKGMSRELGVLAFETLKSSGTIQLLKEQAVWLKSMLDKASLDNNTGMSFNDLKQSYADHGLEDFELFWDNKPVNTLYKWGMYVV